MGYIRRHWQGQHSLQFTLAFSFLLVGAIYHWLEPLVPGFFHTEPYSLIFVSISYLVLTRLLIFPWQIVGLLKSAERCYQDNNRAIILYSVQGIVLISITLSISHTVTRLQQLSAYHQRWVLDTNKETPQYQLNVDFRHRTLSISGDLGFGIVRAVEEHLNTHTEIDQVLLHSRGGQIYEGRGLGLLFRTRGLNTYVRSECSSACTTAFIGGVERTLASDARMGFHQYGMRAGHEKQITVFQSLQFEEKKDIAFFRSQGVDSSFLNSVFSTPHNEIGYPTLETLLEAGVATRLQ